LLKSVAILESILLLVYIQLGYSFLSITSAKSYSAQPQLIDAQPESRLLGLAHDQNHGASDCSCSTSFWVLVLILVPQLLALMREQEFLAHSSATIRLRIKMQDFPCVKSEA